MWKFICNELHVIGPFIPEIWRRVFFTRHTYATESSYVLHYWFSIIHILTQLLALTLYATNIDSVKLEQTFKILISIDVLTSSTLYKSPKCRPYVTDTSYWAISLDWFSIWILLSKFIYMILHVFLSFFLKSCLFIEYWSC